MEKIMIINKFILVLFIALVSMSVKSQTLEQAKNAYFQRNYQKALNIIEQLKTAGKLEASATTYADLLMIAVDIKRDVDDADEALEAFLEKHSNNADVHYMAGLLFIDIANNASFFSKMSNYKSHVKNLIKAAKLAPNKMRYQMEAASAYGQPSMMGGDKPKQKPIVDKLMVGNSAVAQIAMMDYLQNTQNKKAGFNFIKQVVIEFKDNIEVIERAAQLLWTFDKKQQAGDLFTQV